MNHNLYKYLWLPQAVMTSGGRNTMKAKILLTAILLSIIILISACEDGTTNTTGNIVGQAGAALASNTVKVDFYVMSQCPYGTQVEDGIAPVLETLGNNVDFNLNFIGSVSGDGSLSSMHGQPEVDGDIVQLCAAKYNPESYMKMITCMNQNMQSIPGNWETCAESNNLDVESIRTCYEGEEGKDLFKTSIAKAKTLGATGSPTIYINNEKYAGGRTETDFLKAICNAYTGDKPEACTSIPEPVAVQATVLNDKRCVECNAANTISQLRGVFPGLVVKELDYSSQEGNKLYQDLNLRYLPAILFDDSVTQASGYSNVQSYLDRTGQYYSLRVGANFDPSKEICDNNKDDTGNGKVDCADADCAGSMECRKEIKSNLQVFIMSDCPYGRKAVEALYENVNNFGDSMDYEVHYIASEAGTSFNSLHGQYEVDEDIIQLCVFENSPDEWLEYIYCRSTKGVKGVDWKTCATETGVDVDAVTACFNDGTGADLLREDIKIAEGLGVSASPTWLTNNRYKFSGIDAETIKSNICQHNDLTGCSNTLSGSTGAPSGSC